MNSQSIDTILKELGDWFSTNTCQLLTLDKKTNRFNHAGSGTCANIQGLRVIITANHVMGDNPQQSFYVPVYSTKKTQSIELLGYSWVSTSTQDHTKGKDFYDLAYFILSPDTYAQLKPHYSFVSYPLLHPDHEISASYTYFMTGYPYNRLDLLSIKKKSVLQIYYTSIAEDNGGYNYGRTKSTHIAIPRVRKSIHPTTGQKMLMPKFDGMSGGGLWVVEESFYLYGNKGNFKLVGVFTEVDHGYFICTRLDQVLRFMKANRFHADLKYRYTH